MKRVLFLHGLESKANCEKVAWLKSQGYVVLSPSINYREEECYEYVKRLAEMFIPDVIVGSSMGGWFAWNMGKDIGVPVLLLNPAVHSRSVQPEIEPCRDCRPSKVFMALGKQDDVIDPNKTVDWLLENDPLDFNPNNVLQGDYGHRTSVERFIDIWSHFESDIDRSIEFQKSVANEV